MLRLVNGIRWQGQLGGPRTEPHPGPRGDSHRHLVDLGRQGLRGRGRCGVGALERWSTKRIRCVPNGMEGSIVTKDKLVVDTYTRVSKEVGLACGR